MGKLDGLKPFYVYALIDERDHSVFYVGKGQDDRIFQHGKAADRGADATEKLRRIAEIRKLGLKVKEIVIGRFDTAKEALAVESTLIHWVYGLDSLTNITSGHGVDTIRPKGCYDTLQGIDEPFLGYCERTKENRSRNNIIPYLEEIRELIESRCDFKFDDYDTHNPRHTYLIKYYKGVKLTVACHHTAKRSASVTIEAKDGTAESEAQVRYLCDNSKLEWKHGGRYGRIMPAKTFSDPEVILEKFIETLTELEKVPEKQQAVRPENTAIIVEKKPVENPPSKEATPIGDWGKKTPWGHSTTAVSGMIDYCLYHNENGVTFREVALKCGCKENRVKDHVHNGLLVGVRANGRKAIIKEHVNSNNERCYRLLDGFSDQS